MSDYGSILNIIKKTGTIDPAEQDKLQVLLKSVIEAGKYEDALGTAFKSSGSVHNGNALYVVLSQFWYGDGDNQENFEFCKEGDEFDALKLQDNLKQQLGVGYTVEWSFENW